MTNIATHAILLGLSLPLQLAFIPLNTRKKWFTPGELRFWAVAVFVLVEILYMIAF
jgi:hypothetical protein